GTVGRCPVRPVPTTAARYLRTHPAGRTAGTSSTSSAAAPPERGARRREAASGVRAMVPWLLGVAPFGLVVGVSAAQAGIPTLVGWATGPIIYSGSAQVATIELLDGGATPLVVVATALAINLRLVLYSGAMAARWRGQPRWWRMIAAHLLVDPSFAVGTARYQRPGGDGVPAHAHFLGGAVALWCTWVTAI